MLSFPCGVSHHTWVLWMDALTDILSGWHWQIGSIYTSLLDCCQDCPLGAGSSNQPILLLWFFHPLSLSLLEYSPERPCAARPGSPGLPLVVPGSPPLACGTLKKQPPASLPLHAVQPPGQKLVSNTQVQSSQGKWSVQISSVVHSRPQRMLQT